MIVAFNPAAVLKIIKGSFRTINLPLKRRRQSLGVIPIKERKRFLLLMLSNKLPLIILHLPSTGSRKSFF